MVQKWKKELSKISQSLKNINFEKILEDIESRNYSKYNIIQLSGYKNCYRIRVGKYRIIFKDEAEEDVKILAIKSRGQVYRGLQ